MTTNLMIVKPPNTTNVANKAMIQLIPGDDNVDDFPESLTDKYEQQLDIRRINSWILRLNEIHPIELVEVFAVNTLAPFIINSRLKVLLERSKNCKRHIVNVSAMEGKFYRLKTCYHPHTNMAKAALNMMTRTSSMDYAKNGIYMNSIDTGWIDDEKPYHLAQEFAEKHKFKAPIDCVDAAARILDPILDPDNQLHPIYGKFLKDYTSTEW